MNKIVYILGAGCSAGQPPENPGYPLARDFLLALKNYGESLNDKENCNQLKSCVEGSIALLQQEAAQTLDTLTARLGTEAHDLSNGLTMQARRGLERKIRDAKIATYALFMDLEKRARETGLHRYHNFLDELFGNVTNWSQASQKSKFSVLTFNYDRLFEMAFISRFRCDTKTCCLYGGSLLNSGMDYVSGSGIAVASNRFAFLKLHGSVGIRAREEMGHDGPCHYTSYDGPPGENSKTINDEMFFARANNPDPYDRDPEPLIVFPHEKPFVANGTNTLLSFRGYIEPIWNHARQLVSEATEVWAVGYRFAPIDRADVLGLLRSAHNCKKIVVQNRKESVDEICESLKRKWLEPEGLNIKVESHPHPF